MIHFQRCPVWNCEMVQKFMTKSISVRKYLSVLKWVIEDNEDVCNMQVWVMARALCSSQVSGKGGVMYLCAGCTWIDIFFVFSAYWGPDLPLPNLVPASISPEFSARAVNMMLLSFSALRCSQCQLLHTGIIFRFSLCTKPDRAGPWLITDPSEHFPSMEDNKKINK